MHIKKFKNLKIYLVFIRIFNFQMGSIEFTHAFSHSCLPFPKKFGQVMNFYKSLYANLIDTYCKFLQTFSSIVTYWQTLENACLKQMP
jgi:hypothetical protein